MIYMFFILLLNEVLLSHETVRVERSDNQGNFFRKDYTLISENFYKFHTISKTWLQARKTCQREGADLFYPENETEVAAVLDWWNITQPHSWIYVGISALLVKGVFETVDAQPMTDVYNKWCPGEPNDLDGAEDCVVMTRHGGAYNDDRCNKEHSFICKKSLSSLRWNWNCDLPDLDYQYNSNLNSCYKFHLHPMNWTEAYTVCSAEQSHLAVIDSPAEVDVLVNLISSADIDKVTGNYLRGAVHLGFHNRDMSGWRTIKNKPLEISGYSKWGTNQPDGGDDELCGSMFYSGELNDIGCQQNTFFICEYDIKHPGFDFRFAEISSKH